MIEIKYRKKLEDVDYTSDILLSTTRTEVISLIDKTIMSHVNSSEIEVLSIILPSYDIDNTEKWYFDISVLNIHISHKFVNQHFKFQSKVYFELLKALDGNKEVLSLYTESLSEIKTHTKKAPVIAFSFVYKCSDSKCLMFLVDINLNTELFTLYFTKALEIIDNYENNTNTPIVGKIRNSKVDKQNKVFFSLNSDEWIPNNQVFEIINFHGKLFQSENDKRIKKPSAIINENDFGQQLSWNTDWMLKTNGISTLMSQPNDISLYSNISITNLEKAITFWKSNIKDKVKDKPWVVRAKADYFDYFENIITALIFAYTSIEALANICIPQEYEYVEERKGIKKIYSKSAIERHFRLKDKFKIILKEILLLDDVSKSEWWSKFDKLEDLRNEVIHSKASTSEDRYSKLLSKNVFETIRVHTQIIEYIGNHIIKNKKVLLNEFPYGFGFDELNPVFMSDKDMKEYLRDYHGIPNVEIDDETSDKQ